MGSQADPRYQPTMSPAALLLLAAPALAAGRAEPGLVTHVDFLLTLKPAQPVHGEDGDFALVDGGPTRGEAAPLVGMGVGWHSRGFTEVGGRLLASGAEPAALFQDRYREEAAIEGGLNPLSLELLSAANLRLEPYAMADVEVGHVRLAADVFVAATVYAPYGVEAGEDRIGDWQVVVAPGGSVHVQLLESLLRSGVDLGLRASLSRPLNHASPEALDAVDHYARRTGVGPDRFPLGWVPQIGFTMRFDGVD